MFARLNAESRGIEAVPFPPARLGELTALVEGKTVNAQAGKQVLRTMWESGEAPKDVVARLGLAQVSDPGAVKAACEAAIAAEPNAAAAVRAGKMEAFGRLMGAAMKALKGKGDPAAVKATLTDLLR